MNDWLKRAFTAFFKEYLVAVAIILAGVTFYVLSLLVPLVRDFLETKAPLWIAVGVALVVLVATALANQRSNKLRERVQADLRKERNGVYWKSHANLLWKVRVHLVNGTLAVNIVDGPFCSKCKTALSYRGSPMHAYFWICPSCNGQHNLGIQDDRLQNDVRNIVQGEIDRKEVKPESPSIEW